MLYKQLTESNTNIWINNLDKIIKLNELLLKKSKERNITMINEYQEKYRASSLGKILYAKECILFGGKIYENFNSWFPLRRMTPYNKIELLVEEHTDEYFYEKKEELEKTFERWTKYASKPFQIEEKDVIFYQEMKQYHAEALIIAKGLGLDYESFNLDEDC